jgi:hypothetical protein
VSAVGLPPANVPEAAVAGDIAADLGAAGWHLAELHIGRACLSSALVGGRGPDPAIFCKAWRVRKHRRPLRQRPIPSGHRSSARRHAAPAG